MDYQGFMERPAEELPQTGDLLVLKGGAQVVTVQTWDGMEHLVPVPVDVWAGHIGVVLGAEVTEKENNPYIQVHLLSANWGVNASPLGVVGSCFNADESTFLVPRGYAKAIFYKAADPAKMRERMVNRANRWAQLGLAANSQGSLDGFPLSPSGFISEVLQPVNSQPLVPGITDIAGSLVEVDPNGVLPGDIVIFGEKNNPALGVVDSITPNLQSSEMEFGVVSFRPAGRVTGPELWKITGQAGNWTGTFPDGEKEKIRFYRYTGLPAFPAIINRLSLTGAPGEDIRVVLDLTNGGLGELTVNHLYLRLYPVQTDGIVQAKPVAQISLPDIVVKSGEKITTNSEITPPSTGEFRLVLDFQGNDGRILSLEAGQLTVN